MASYNIISIIVEYADIETIVKLCKVDANIFSFVTKEQLVNRLFDIIMVIDITKPGVDNFESIDIYEKETITYDEKINFIELINTINDNESLKIFCEIYFDCDFCYYNEFLYLYDKFD